MGLCRRDLVYTGFMSLDGVVDSRGGGPGEEHRSGGWAVKDLEFVPEAWSLKGEELTATTALMSTNGREAFFGSLSGFRAFRRARTRR